MGATSGLMGVLATKAVALGFVAGIGVLGVGEAARRVVSEPSAFTVAPVASVATVASAAWSPVGAVASSNALSIESPSGPLREGNAIAPALSASTAVGAALSPTALPTNLEARLGSMASQKREKALERDVVHKTAEANALASAPSHHNVVGAAASAVTVRRAPLVEQARELAATKRLIDAGSMGEALRRLQASYLNDYDSALAEEREALYIDVLSRSGRAAEAQRRAERFLANYPASPYRTKMRAIVSPP